MGLGDIIRNVQDAVQGRERIPEEEGENRQEGVVDRVVDAVTGREPNDEEQATERASERYGRNVRPASEDPRGDPADQAYGRQGGYETDRGDDFSGRGDQYGNEEQGAEQASERYGRNVRPASEDPLGDPADQERHSRF